MSADPAAIYEIFAAHRQELAFWENVAASLEKTLIAGLRSKRLLGKVEVRAKTTGSVISKAHRKAYPGIDQYGDLVGGRVTVPFGDLVEPVADLLQRAAWCDVVKDDHKTVGPTELAYQARHLDLVLLEGDDSILPAAPGLGRAVRCEIQLHTLAEGLWANTNHLVTYKREDVLSPEVRRRMNRLIALCELFDAEVVATRDEARLSADAAELVGRDLVQYAQALTGRDQAEPTGELLAELLPAVPNDQLADYPALLERFVGDHAERLTHVLVEEAPDRELPLLYTPEAIMVFERLTNARLSSPHAWTSVFSDPEIHQLEAIWPPL